MIASARAIAVLDNEAAQAVADLNHPKHRRLADVLNAADLDRVRLVVPTAVRIEARVSPGPRKGTGLGRFRVDDIPLDSRCADRAIALADGLSASAVDATVVQCAEEFAVAGARVTVYTSDVRDIEALCGRATGRIAVRRV